MDKSPMHEVVVVVEEEPINTHKHTQIHCYVCVLHAPHISFSLLQRSNNIGAELVSSKYRT